VLENLLEITVQYDIESAETSAYRVAIEDSILKLETNERLTVGSLGVCIASGLARSIHLPAKFALSTWRRTL
jgi:hypothetical protein